MLRRTGDHKQVLQRGRPVRTLGKKRRDLDEPPRFLRDPGDRSDASPGRTGEHACDGLRRELTRQRRRLAVAPTRERPQLVLTLPVRTGQRDGMPEQETRTDLGSRRRIVARKVTPPQGPA
jgi:hypothetical protein